MYEIALNSLFTRTERFLIRNQSKPFVLREYDGNPSDDSSNSEPMIDDFRAEKEDRFHSMREKLLIGITNLPAEPKVK